MLVPYALEVGWGWAEIGVWQTSVWIGAALLWIPFRLMCERKRPRMAAALGAAAGVLAVVVPSALFPVSSCGTAAVNFVVLHAWIPLLNLAALILLPWLRGAPHIDLPAAATALAH